MSERDDESRAGAGELAEVGQYENLEQAHEHGLVILAMREPCLVSETETPGRYSLHSVAAAAPKIVEELHAYEEEKEICQPAPLEVDWFRYSAGWDVFAIWALMLIGAYIWQHGNPASAEHAASSSIRLIGHGEWWRPFTALFLHADVPHLVGNLLSGMCFGTLVARTIGPWRGWLLIIACGAVGNAMVSALAWPESFTAIGASTAVFSALGILSGVGFVSLLRSKARLPWAKTAAPVLAGLVLLGWLGGGPADGNTDVLGHTLGFASGLSAGALVGIFTRKNCVIMDSASSPL
jgi:membrane associated rhomboid family serine protease